MDRKIVQRDIENLVGPILERNLMELVDVVYLQEAGRWVLRVFIDKPGGVNLDDCAFISHQIGDLIEVEDVIPQRYFLEVSSPGLDRVLKKEADFRRFCGEKARIKTREALNGRRNFKGRILRCGQGVLELEDSEGERFEFSLEEIETARLEYRGKSGNATVRGRE
jgi:ribosome maturation factor RimP